MKKFFSLPKLPFIVVLFLVWRVALSVLGAVGAIVFPSNPLYVGPSIWANFDGVHYVTIAQFGYQGFEQAFFPVYPLLIRFVAHYFLSYNYTLAGLMVSNISFLLLLFLMWKLLELSKIGNKPIDGKTIRWTLIFFVFFPTSYYFGSVYTESLFMLLVVGSFYFLHQRKFFWYAIAASAASGVRLVGVFLLVPVGLFAYMAYLGQVYHDPLLFVHAQPAFGAGRSGGEPIFLPQVYFRYFNMFLRLATGQDIATYNHLIAFLELLFFHGAFILLYLAWKKKYPMEWVYFSAAAIIFPTLSGTLSSMMRYVLVAFPLYIVLATFPMQYRVIILSVFLVLFSVLTMLFTRGIWVS